MGDQDTDAADDQAENARRHNPMREPNDRQMAWRCCGADLSAWLRADWSCVQDMCAHALASQRCSSEAI
jgi:hypothetical protein